LTAESLCMGCMQDKGTAAKCPHCEWREGGPADSPLQLSPRTVLNGCYLIGRALGQGGFGITYLAWDLNLDRKLALKEYFPRDLCTRGRDESTVQALTENFREAYENGRKQFLDEGRALARFQDHPGIVSVLAFFQENGTAYIVMGYMDGLTFKQYLEGRGGKIGFNVAFSMLRPVMETLKEVHAVGMLHRDISPDNIYVSRNGQVKLLDFGNARFAVGEQSRSLDVILKPGYAPYEQYRSRGKQGPWTDVYALGATLYRAVTGQTPSPAPDRMAHDDLVPPSRLGVVIPSKSDSALLRALALRQEDRFQSIATFENALVEVPDLGVTTPSPRSESKVGDESGQPSSLPPRDRRTPGGQRRAWQAVVSISIIGIIAAAVLWLVWPRTKKGRLRVTANIGGAQIAIDGQGRRNCTAPCNLTLSVGEYHLTGTKTGYTNVDENEVKVVPGQTILVNLRFEPYVNPPGHLTVTANVVGVQVAITGQSQKNCVAPCKLDMSPGEYHVQGMKPGYSGNERAVMIAAGKTVPVVLQLSPSVATLIEQGESDYQHERYNDAIHAFQEAIGLNPGDGQAAQAHLLLCNVLARKQAWGEASLECRKAAQLNPNDAPLHSELGVVLGHLYDWTGTIAEEEIALRLDPNNAKSHLALAVALNQTGNKREALSEIRKAHQLAPANPGITKIYDQLTREVN
jgi:serine/threonine protein kinase